MHRGESGWSQLDSDLKRRVVNFINQQFPRLRTVEVEAFKALLPLMAT